MWARRRQFRTTHHPTGNKTFVVLSGLSLFVLYYILLCYSSFFLSVSCYLFVTFSLRHNRKEYLRYDHQYTHLPSCVCRFRVMNSGCIPLKNKNKKSWFWSHPSLFFFFYPCIIVRLLCCFLFSCVASFGMAVFFFFFGGVYSCGTHRP